MATPILDNLDLTLNQLLNVILQLLAADPGTLQEGRLWWNSTAHEPKVYDGTTTHILAFLDAVVNSIAAGDSTITIGGTSTAPTVKVAKALDHTWITDFIAEVETVSIDQLAAQAADYSANNHKITNLSDATNPQDAVNLRTLLNNVSGLSASQEVRYATAAALAANTYANGASGVGATLTANANGALLIDGQTPTVNDRVLIQNEATAANNGIYTVTQVGDGSHPYILTRATDFNQSTNIGPGILVPVKASSQETAGTANDQKVFMSISKSAPTVGTDSVTFSLIGSTYTAGTGLTLTGTQFALTTPVSIANGGTNATTAAAARTNLAATTKYAASIGDGSTLAYTVTHSLGTTDITVDVWETGGSKRKVIVDTAISDANNIVVTFTSAPAANAYRVVVVG
jgi:hypothetical protein